MDAASQLAQLVVCALGALERQLDELRGVLGAVAKLLLGELEREDRAHEPLLGAVVQVPFDAPARLIGRGHDPAA